MSDGFTKFPNWLLDQMDTFTPYEWLIVCAIVRKTAGYQKAEDKLSYSQIMELTGIKHKKTVSNCLSSLIERGVICRRDVSKQGICYSLTGSPNEPVQLVHQMNRFTKRTGTGSPNEPEPVHQMNTQKKERKERKAAAAAGAISEKPTAFAAYQDNIGQLTPILASSIGDWVDEVGEQWVIDAIAEAALNNGRSWRYVEAILKRWQREGRAASGKGNGSGDEAAVWEEIKRQVSANGRYVQWSDWQLTDQQRQAADAIGGKMRLLSMDIYNERQMRQEFLAAYKGTK